jgi:mannosylglycoprotein endo-beta-mannosidase
LLDINAFGINQHVCTTLIHGWSFSLLQAQLANYHQYRALIEGWNTWMWTHYTGVLIWKTQNPWPGLRGQMYDHLLDQTGAYFGVQHAAEPCHVQLNLLTYNITVSHTLE